jgi:hypothetical protein
MGTMNTSLPDAMKEFIEEQVELRRTNAQVRARLRTQRRMRP